MDPLTVGCLITDAPELFKYGHSKEVGRLQIAPVTSGTPSFVTVRDLSQNLGQQSSSSHAGGEWNRDGKERIARGLLPQVELEAGQHPVRAHCKGGTPWCVCVLSVRSWP